MWRKVLLTLCLALSGCTGFQSAREAPGSGRLPPVVAADSTIMRRLMGQDVLDQPLLPQPGDIWADVLPAARSGPPAATPASGQSLHRPVVAAASRAGLPRPATPAIAAAEPAAALRPAAALPRAAALPPAVPTVAKAVPPTGFRLVVQLAASRSPQRAEAEWHRLRQQARKLTDGHLPAVSEAEVNGQHVWRLRAAGFADVAEASAFCTGIRAVKADCWVVPPSASP